MQRSTCNVVVRVNTPHCTTPLHVTLLLLLQQQHLQVIDEFMEVLPKVGVAAAKRAFDRPQKPPAAPADDKPADSKQ
jgi:hypothetical protein